MHDNRRYVLMLENDSDDKYFTESTLAELNLNIPVIFSSDRELLTENHANPPSLILIAYNIYPHTGIEILKKLKTSSVFGHIPTVVLCEDIPAEEIRKYYQAGANSVIKKPSTVELTQNKISTFFNYWFNVAEL